MDTICQEADSSIRYQLHGFDLPLHTAGNVLGENYVPVGSFLNYDTVGRITLTIHPIYFVSDTLLVYDSQMPFAFNDTVFSTEGTHTVVLPTIHGCDSTVDVMLYVATCPQDTQLVAAYSVCDVAAFPLSAPVVVPAPIPMSNDAPQRYMVGDTTLFCGHCRLPDNILIVPKMCMSHFRLVETIFTRMTGMEHNTILSEWVVIAGPGKI
jgi:hypothetical protein